MIATSYPNPQISNPMGHYRPSTVDQPSMGGQPLAHQAVRTIFLSDTHLGSRYANCRALLDFLGQHQPRFLYLVGDIVDGWSLRRRWHWNATYNTIVHRLFQLAAEGTTIRYAPGNHDAFMRSYLLDFGIVEVADEFVHETADGRLLSILHGDRFDDVELRAPWLSVIGSSAYETLMWANGLVNHVRMSFGLERRCYTAAIKQSVKRAVTFVSDFESRLMAHAQATGCDGIVCGHVHTPVIRSRGQITYFNTGDWVEHCTALFEFADGAMELRQYPLEPGSGEEVVLGQWHPAGDGARDDRSSENLAGSVAQAEAAA